MDIIKDITKLNKDFGVKKSVIARNINISRQLLDFRMRTKSDFKPEEKYLFYKIYETMLNIN